jgi:hypothetical protein
MEPVGEVDAMAIDSQGDDSDVSIISLVTPNKRRKKQQRKSPQPTPGADALDYKSVANEGIHKLPEKQQWLVPQRDDLTFDCSELPCNYISLPVEKFFKLFEKFKCRKCHALKQKSLRLNGLAGHKVYTISAGIATISSVCVRANLTGTLEKPGLRRHATKHSYKLTSIIVFI